MTTSTNRLAVESSLYLKQHASNPVDWYPWGPDALERARSLDRPIFLSIGYSACHWCHVMEHESFEDEATARVLNEHFVSIKVDREERPDLDTIYMTALQALTHEGGGWPLSVWLTPDLHPFYAGTYFPPTNRYGRPSFVAVLNAIHQAWMTRRDEITQQAGEVVRLLNERPGEDGVGELNPQLLKNASRALTQAFDSTHGGFGRAPKFPHAIELRLLLRCWKRFGDETALHMVRFTLDRMAAGGIFDQIGGGFHRYSTDQRWLVPHFEKMLYDNALLTSALVEAYQATRDPEFRRVAEETLDYVLREMTAADGAFYSTQDADSEGVEGKFYVWSLAEIQSVLGQSDAAFFATVFDITPGGNWEGHNIPNRPKSWDNLAQSLAMPADEIRTRCREMAHRLYAERAKRVWPGRDEKILSAWNGLMVAAFARAGAAFDEPKYTEAATRAADFVLDHLRRPDGRLHRTTAIGHPARLNGYLEDYACLIDALIELYESTFGPRWIAEAIRLADVMIEDFADPAGGGFFYTASGHETLITRTKDSYDGSTPSGNAMAVTGLLRLAAITERRDYRDLAERTLAAFSGLMERSPSAAGQMLMALDFYLGPIREIAIVGPAPQTESVVRAVRRHFLPNVVLASHGSTNRDGEPIALLRDRPPTDQVTTYICENATCQAPAIGVADGLAAVEAIAVRRSPNAG